jgi:hypothetical protein
MKKSLRTALAISLLMLLFGTCKHKPDIMPYIVPPVDTSGNHASSCSPDSVYFVNTILPLIASNCAMAGCHDAITRAEGLSLTNYADIVRLVRPGYPNNSKLYRNMIGLGDQMMPPAGELPQAQLDLIYKWILQGAKNNYCSSQGNCDTTNVSYLTGLVPVINIYCRGCHNSGNPSQGVNLDNYNGVLTEVNNGQLLGGITGKLSPMPKYSLPLSQCNIGKFRQWIKEGAKNN